MLFTKQELILNGVVEADYKELVNEVTKGIDPIGDTEPFFDVLVTYYAERSAREIRRLITTIVYQQIVDKTTGNADLEEDIKTAEIKMTQGYLIEARKRLLDDGFVSNSQQGVTVTKDINLSSQRLHREALVLIRRHYANIIG